MDKDESYYWATKELQHDKEQEMAQEVEEGMRDTIRLAYINDPMFVITAVHETPNSSSWDDMVRDIYKQMEGQTYVSEQDAQRMYAQIGMLLCGRLDEYLDELEEE